ncbi:MAG TPA: hypothetical protein VI753_01355 [Anaerolineales bacterium]|nr:hypothetical protein [Anaerolineales bacterium]
MLKQVNNIEQTTDFVTAGRSPAFLYRTFVITWESAIVIILAVVTLLSRLLMLAGCRRESDKSYF